jgi:mannose-6-phosphate isomerase-like protein (cupin superfamily)
MRKSIAAVLFTATLVSGAAYTVAQDAIVRTPLQKSEYPGLLHMSHLMHITVAPGGLVPRHTHPGIEMGFVQEGEGTLTIEGSPELVLKAGSSYSIPAGAIHSAKNTGTTPLKIIGTFVVEKDKPLATPAP